MGCPASRGPIAADHDAVMGRFVALDRAFAARSEVLCECGHPLYVHRELPRENYAIANGAIVATANPDYRPLHVHCDHADCGCVKLAST